MKLYFRPLVQCGPARPAQAFPLAGGGACWFTHAEVLSHDAAPQIIPASEIPLEIRARLTLDRSPIRGLDMTRPVVMGILNVTPDSFSDGGLHDAPEQALARAQDMVAAGAQVIDIGGESTRPGAEFVPHELEATRTAPVIAALRRAGLKVPISIDTRKASVAQAALDAGATLVNDVSGFTFDNDLAPLCAAKTVPVCVMHAQGDPATMQDNPSYENVLLDVFDFLEGRITALEQAGIARTRIIADPGLGFGKRIAHNLALLSRISLFHALGVPILLGASRKGFIGKIGGAQQADARAPGSIAVALAALAQGVQIVRVHDVAETCQAIALWEAVQAGETEHG